MPVPVGTASFQDIEDEFGGSHPITLTEYYGGAVGIPASGTISVNDFRGKSSIFTFSITTNQTDANLRTLAIAAGWDESTPVEATIDSGIYISGSVGNNSTPALTIDGAWAAGVTLFNNGTIAGCGGGGGVGGGTNANGSDGLTAGLALLVSVAVTLQNNGTIAGGGGGGGGGGGSRVAWTSRGGGGSQTSRGGGGGGGRSGATSSAGGIAGLGAGAGSAGTTSSGGGGGVGSYTASGSRWSRGGNGGGGGEYGAGGAGGGGGTTGGSGTKTNRSGGGGGAAGQAISGNSNITYTETGTILGAIV